MRTRVFGYVVTFLCAFALSACDVFVSPETRIERARAHIERAEHRAALVQVKNALAKDPELQGARLLLAELALWLGDPASAETELERVRPEYEPARARRLRGEIDLALGHFQKALDDSNATDGLLDADSALLLRGRAQIGLRDGVGAERTFREGLERAAIASAARIGLIEALAMQGKRSEALALAEQLVRDEPTSARALFARAQLLVREDPAEALELLRRAQVEAVRQLDVRMQIELLTLLAELQLDRGALDEARQSSATLSRTAPGTPIATLISSRIAMAENDYPRAAADLRRIVNAAPRFAQARFLLAAALFAQGNLEQASQELGIVVEQAPEMLAARQLFAQVRMRLNDPDGALRALVPALETGSERSRGIHGLMGTLRSQLGTTGRAVGLLEQELAKDPDNHALALELAGAYLENGKAKQARQLLEQREALQRDSRAVAIRLQAVLAEEGAEAGARQARTALTDNPGDPNVVSVAAIFLAHVGKVGEARQHLGQALQRMPKSPELLLASARLEWSEGSLDGAREAMRALLEHAPAHAEARLALAELELASGNIASAEQELERLRQENPRAVQPRMLLARAALARNELKRAEQLIDEILEQRDDVAVYLAAGDAYLMHGRYAQAIPLYRQVVELESHNAAGWLNLGRAQLALGQHALARASFERAQSARPNWMPAEGALVFVDLEDGNSAGALGRIEALKAAHPSNPSVLALEGQALMMLHRYREAAAAFEEAATIDFRREFALAAYQARLAARDPAPWQPLERWIAMRSGDLGARGLLADAYMKAGEEKKAIAQYEFIVARAPSHAASLNNLAWLYQQRGDARALDVARRAYAAAPDVPAVSDTLGWILVERGQIEEALEHLERAAQAARGNPDIQYHYAVALARSGATKTARDRLEQLFAEHTAFSSYDEAQQLLATLSGASHEGVL